MPNPGFKVHARLPSKYKARHRGVHHPDGAASAAEPPRGTSNSEAWAAGVDFTVDGPVPQPGSCISPALHASLLEVAGITPDRGAIASAGLLLAALRTAIRFLPDPGPYASPALALSANTRADAEGPRSSGVGLHSASLAATEGGPRVEARAEAGLRTTVAMPDTALDLHGATVGDLDRPVAAVQMDAAAVAGAMASDKAKKAQTIATARAAGVTAEVAVGKAKKPKQSGGRQGHGCRDDTGHESEPGHAGAGACHRFRYRDDHRDDPRLVVAPACLLIGGSSPRPLRDDAAGRQCDLRRDIGGAADEWARRGGWPARSSPQ